MFDISDDTHSFSYVEHLLPSVAAVLVVTEYSAVNVPAILYLAPKSTLVVFPRFILEFTH